MSHGHLDLVCSHVLRSQFKSNRSALDFPAVELEARVVVLAVVNLGSNSSVLKLFSQFVSTVKKHLRVIGFVEDWNDHDLGCSYFGRENNTGVV